MKEVYCPTCQKITNFSEQNIYRPFCSERCRLIDLGQWAEEKYKIPCQENPPEKNISDKNNSEDDEN